MEYPAAPAPDTRTLISSTFFPTIFRAFIRAATVTMAVPCWSSWNTGMSSISLSLFSIYTHLGDDMSSRFIPPKPGAMFFTVSIISSASWVSRTIGTAFTSPNSLKSTAFPSITGMAAFGPMFPSPRTADPSDTTAIVFAFDV